MSRFLFELKNALGGRYDESMGKKRRSPAIDSAWFTQEMRDAFAAFGRFGGEARAKRLSKARRSEIARRAARARWKAKPKPSSPSTGSKG